MKGADTRANNHPGIISAVTGMVEFGMVPPLLGVFSRWYLPVVLTIIYNPFALVEPPLPQIDILKMLYALIPGYPVNSKEVLEQYCPLPGNPNKEQMPDLVALLTQCFKTHQVLIASIFIEQPFFMAVHPALTTAYLTVATSLAINGSAKTVPLVWR